MGIPSSLEDVSFDDGVGSAQYELSKSRIRHSSLEIDGSPDHVTSQSTTGQEMPSAISHLKRSPPRCQETLCSGSGNSTRNTLRMIMLQRPDYGELRISWCVTAMRSSRGSVRLPTGTLMRRIVLRSF